MNFFYWNAKSDSQLPPALNGGTIDSGGRFL
jgi:hypothetical protein